MTPDSAPSMNTLLQYGDGNSPEGWTTVANVSSITSCFSMSATVKDVTSHSTNLPWRKKRTTLLDAGQISCKLFWIPGDAGHIALRKIFTNRQEKDWRVVWANGATPWIVTGSISKHSLSAPVDGVYEADINIE